MDNSGYSEKYKKELFFILMSIILMARRNHRKEMLAMMAYLFPFLMTLLEEGVIMMLYLFPLTEMEGEILVLIYLMSYLMLVAMKAFQIFKKSMDCVI